MQNVSFKEPCGPIHLGWNSDPSKKNILFGWLVENKGTPKKSEKKQKKGSPFCGEVTKIQYAASAYDREAMGHGFIHSTMQEIYSGKMFQCHRSGKAKKGVLPSGSEETHLWTLAKNKSTSGVLCLFHEVGYNCLASLYQPLPVAVSLFGGTLWGKGHQISAQCWFMVVEAYTSMQNACVHIYVNARSNKACGLLRLSKFWGQRPSLAQVKGWTTVRGAKETVPLLTSTPRFTYGNA